MKNSQEEQVLTENVAHPDKGISSQHKLSVVIVNYNVRYFLEQALKAAIRASENIDAQIFVVDNNSSDDSVEMVRQKFPGIHLIANEDNKGFSSANNQAIRQATGEYILLLNPDTVVEEDTFMKCIDFMDGHPEAGGLGVKMIDGKGNFLPESKRGFPSPFVAFTKAFGLSRLFPKSKLFNKYHLGFLDKEETHEVEVLSGAFMMIRKSVLDKIGLLDETFFMYGEDIDLSYRIVQAGYKNYYFPDTTIIHYKGESTRKGSLNYVRVFYKAMIIFAKKHFKGEGAWMLVLMLQLAIYFRAILTVINNLFRNIFRPLVDAAIIAGGLFFLKEFWATRVFQDPDHFLPLIVTFSIPLYTLIWVSSIFFTGGYDKPYNIPRLIRGIAVGTVILAAIYAFLPLEFRTSRALILLGALLSFFTLWIARMADHFLKFRNFKLDEGQQNNLIIVGSDEESERVKGLLYQAQIQKNIIGTVASGNQLGASKSLGSSSQLDELVYIYNINEIVFCSKDISSQEIMSWMTKLGPEIDYRIVPEESLSIIGSNSKNTAGDLYTIDIRFNLSETMSRRNKRVIDLFGGLLLLVLFPLLILFVKNKGGYFLNIFDLIFARKSLVGYAQSSSDRTTLPAIKNGILSPIDALNIADPDDPTIARLNFLYAKDYSIERDLQIVFKNLKNLGRRNAS